MSIYNLKRILSMEYIGDDKYRSTYIVKNDKNDNVVFFKSDDKGILKKQKEINEKNMMIANNHVAYIKDKSLNIHTFDTDTDIKIPLNDDYDITYFNALLKKMIIPMI